MITSGKDTVIATVVFAACSIALFIADAVGDLDIEDWPVDAYEFTTEFAVDSYHDVLYLLNPIPEAQKKVAYEAIGKYGPMRNPYELLRAAGKHEGIVFRRDSADNKLRELKYYSDPDRYTEGDVEWTYIVRIDNYKVVLDRHFHIIAAKKF